MLTRHRAPPAARPGRALLVSAGVTVAVAFLIGVAGGSAVSEDLALRHALASLPPAERALRVAWSGQMAPGRLCGARPHRAARSGSLTAQPLTRSVELGDVRFGSGPRQARGGQRHRPLRPPARRAACRARCTPARCEVVQIGGTPLRRVDEYGVHLVVVGTRDAHLARAVRRRRARDAADRRRHPARARLLSSSIRGLASLPPLRLFSRSYGWTAALDPGTAHVWDVDRLLAAEGRAEARLTAANGQFGLTAPDDALAEARSAGRTASRRVLLVGGAAAVLLLAFAGLTAGALRRDVRAELRRLGQRGATLSQQAAFVLAEALSAVLPGVARRARRSASRRRGHRAPRRRARRPGALARPRDAGQRRARRRRRARRARRGRARAAAAARRPAARRAARRHGGRRRRRRARAAARRRLARRRRARRRARAHARRHAAARELRLRRPARTPARARASASGLRASRKAPVTLRLALLALHRSPSRAAGVAGFLAVSVGLATFALSYRATLDGSSTERAAYAVPLDYTLNEGAALVAPRDAASLARYRALAPGVGAWPVLRQVADAAGTRGRRSRRPSSACRRTPSRCCTAGAATSPRTRRPSSRACCDPRTPVALAGARSRAPATRLELPVRMTGSAVQLVLVVQTRDGDAAQLRPPRAAEGRRPDAQRAACPRPLRGGRVVAIQLQLPSNDQRSAAHSGAEGRNGAEGFAGRSCSGGSRP